MPSASVWKPGVNRAPFAVTDASSLCPIPSHLDRPSGNTCRSWGLGHHPSKRTSGRTRSRTRSRLEEEGNLPPGVHPRQLVIFPSQESAETVRITADAGPVHHSGVPPKKHRKTDAHRAGAVDLSHGRKAALRAGEDRAPETQR